MSTLTLTVGQSTDDAMLDDSAYDATAAQMRVGGVGTAPLVNHGQGWRFAGVTISGADTINSADLRLMKSGAAWSQQDNRWTFEDSDDAATFSAGSPPGARTIVASPVTDSNDVNELDGTVYSFPRSGGNRTTFGARLASVLARGGWSSGNAVAVINNSDQDASAYVNFGRKLWHAYDSATASSEPQLVIDYTAAVPWQDQAGGTTDIHLTIDEASADDADYIRSSLSPANQPYTTPAFAAATDPGVNTGHYLRYRYRKQAAGNEIDLTVSLRQGATEIASWLEDNIGTAWVTQDRLLSGAQADAITDYANLTARFVANETPPAAPTYIGMSAAVANTATNNAALNTAWPTGYTVTAEDVAVVVAQTASNVAFTAPTGYTAITPDGGTDNNGASHRTQAWYRRLQAGDSAPSVPGIASNTVRTAFVFIVRGCPTTGDPILAINRANASSATTTVTFNAHFNIAIPNTLSVAVAAYDDNITAIAQISEWSTFAVINTATGTDQAMALATRTFSGTGTVPGGSTTASGAAADLNAGFHFLFSPPTTPARANVSWVKWEVPVTGPSTYTFSGSGTTPAPTGSGTGIQFTAPVYTLSGNSTSPVPNGSGSGFQFTGPTYVLSGNGTSPIPSGSGAGIQFVAPVYILSGSGTSPAPAGSGAGIQVINPSYTLSGSGTSPAPTGSGVGFQFSNAVFTLSGSGTAPAPTGPSGSLVGSSTFALQNFVDALALGPDGYTWAQGNPIVVDKFGKIVALRQKHNAGIRFAFSNDGGANWGQSSTEINFITRGALAYDHVNDIFHVLWSATGGSDGVIYRRYTPSRDGSNNLTDFTQVAGINLQLEADATIATWQPVLLWLDDADYGTYGALVALWSSSNASNGQIHASMRVLSNTVADNTGSNWRRLDGGTSNDAGLITSTYGVPTSAVSAAQVSHVGLTAIRKRAGTKAGDLYIAYAVNNGEAYFRRYPWAAATDNWGAPTTAAQLFDLITGTGRTEGQEWELFSKWAEGNNGEMYVAGARWDGSTNGETWSVYKVDSSDAVSLLADAYSVGGQFQPSDYALTGDIIFDSVSGKLISAHVASGVGTNNAVLKVYDPSGTLEQTETVFTAADVDIPILWQDPLTGDCRFNGTWLVIFRDTDGYPATAPPYRGWFGTVTVGAAAGGLTFTPPVYTLSGNGTSPAPTGSGAGLQYTSLSILSGSGTASGPTGSGVGLTYRSLSTFSGSGTTPAPSGSGTGLIFAEANMFTLSGSGTAPAPIGSGTGLTFTTPVYTFSGSGTVAVPTGSGTGLTFVAPVYTISGNGTTPAPTGSGMGLAFTAPIYTLSGNGTVVAPTGSGAGLTFTTPSYTLSGSGVAPAPTGSGAGFRYISVSVLSGNGIAPSSTGTGTGLTFVTPVNTLSGGGTAPAPTGSGVGLTYVSSSVLSGSGTAPTPAGFGTGLTFVGPVYILSGTGTTSPPTGSGVGFVFSIVPTFIISGSGVTPPPTGSGPGLVYTSNSNLSGAGAAPIPTGSGAGISFIVPVFTMSGSGTAPLPTGSEAGLIFFPSLSALSGLGTAPNPAGSGVGLLFTEPLTPYVVPVDMNPSWDGGRKSIHGNDGRKLVYSDGISVTWNIDRQKG